MCFPYCSVCVEPSDRQASVTSLNRAHPSKNNSMSTRSWTFLSLGSSCYLSFFCMHFNPRAGTAVRVFWPDCCHFIWIVPSPQPHDQPWCQGLSSSVSVSLLEHIGGFSTYSHWQSISDIHCILPGCTLLIQLMGCGQGIDRKLGLLGSWLRMGGRAARWIRTDTGHSKGARHTRLISTARCENLAPDTGFHRHLLKDHSLPASQGQPRGGAMHHSQNAISMFTFLKY